VLRLAACREGLDDDHTSTATRAEMRGLVCRRDSFVVALDLCRRLLDLHRYRGDRATMGLEWCHGQRGQRPAFARLNYSPSAWPHSIARMTLSFGIGQTLGPIATGAMTDASGSLSYALNVSAVMLVAGAIACMIHAATTRDGAPRTQPLQRGGSA